MIKIETKRGNRFFLALKAKYEAEILASEATLETYFNHSVGIGEHSDLITEFDIQLEKLASAKDKLDALQNSFEEYKEKL